MLRELLINFVVLPVLRYSKKERTEQARQS